MKIIIVTYKQFILSVFIEIYAYYRYDDSEKRMYIKGGNKDKKGGRTYETI